MPDLRRDAVGRTRLLHLLTNDLVILVAVYRLSLFTSESTDQVKILLSRLFGLKSTKNTLQKYNNYSLIAIKHILEWINTYLWIWYFRPTCR